ncbi:hypothetical protein [Geomonas sp.]|uniref:hypothetical protein n=1 Tax=Geomonas sp. TaxID=2651584 RepID=UPI002B4662D2|nr:hypothetical protein [Geomonas sp.]HJV34627.1 hypothetical protein [Geomonas sp.]
MIYVTLDLSGNDRVFISNCYRYESGLRTLALYREPPPGLPSHDEVKAEIDGLQGDFEGGANGDRVFISKRKMARKKVTEMFKNIMSYLRSVAKEDDIPALIQAGFGVRRFGGRKKSVVAPA